MVAGGSMRASDDDRERVVAVLRDQTAEGRLTLDEFEERMSAAYTAKTYDDLRTLTKDLPVDVHLAGQGTRQGRAPRPSAPERLRRRFPVRPAFRFAPWMLFPAIWLVATVASGRAAAFTPFLVIGVIWFGMSVCRGCGGGRLHGGR